MELPVNPVQSERSNSRRFGHIETKDATSTNFTLKKQLKIKLFSFFTFIDHIMFLTTRYIQPIHGFWQI